MIPALLATLLFACSSVSGRRNVRLLGSAPANFWRQLFALALLGVYAHTLGHGFQGIALGWFFLSGFVGYGLGDVGIYMAFPRLGTRLTALMTQCLAAPLGVLMAWGWHGSRPTSPQLVAAALILGGVAIALAPSRNDPPTVRSPASGIAWGLLAAVGQAGGQVLSKHGFKLAQAAGEPADPVTVAYQRLFPGLAVGLSWFLLDHFYFRPADLPKPDYRRAWPWILLNTLAGPTLGVAAYQWATKIAETSVVLSITAMTPLCVVPLAYVLEGERPTKRSLAGGVVAVAGVICLALAA